MARLVRTRRDGNQVFYRLENDHVARLVLDAVHNAEVVRRVLAGDTGPVRDIVLLNAAAGIVAYELFRDASQVQRPIVERMSDARDRAAAAIDDGAAASVLDRWVEATTRTVA